MAKWFYLIGFIFITLNSNGGTCLLGDCTNGYGILINDNGNRYLGEFKNGTKHGQGVYYYTANIKYSGSWKNDTRDGEGRMYANGQISQAGNWKNNNLIVPNKQIGCISGNCNTGIGTFLYKDGRKLFARFQSGQPIEQVVCYSTNGEKYIGQWKDDDRSDYGICYTENGEIQSGLWNGSIFLGELKTSKIQKGCVSGNCIQGEGTYIYPDETRYNGSFLNNLANGFGICYYADGEIYIGEWKNHTFNGKGTMYFNDGTIIEGDWKNGVFQNASNEEAIEIYYDYKEEASVQPKIWIVLVGVSRYTAMPSLKYTDDDAFKLHSFYKSPAGGALPDEQIKILVDEDANKDNITKTLKEITSKANKQDMVMFFFSGHGISGAFLPSDYDGRMQIVSHKEILDIMESSKAKSKVVIADACHSGSFTEKGESYEAALNHLYSAFNNSRGGTLLLLSSKAEETSIESNGLRQGVFSHFLIEGLKGKANMDNDDIITVEEAFEYIYTNVRQFTNNRQSPVIRGNFDTKMPLGSSQY